MKYIFALLFFLGLTASAQAAPSCAQLNEAWPKYHQRAQFVGWENKPFPCPSEEANVATAFYYLENIKIIGNDGREIFDYYEYVMGNLEYVFRADDSAASFASRNIIYIGSGIFATHNDKGVLLNPVGIDGPTTLVHERKHMDVGNVKHVKCKPSDAFRNCASRFHSLHDGNANIGDLDVDAYSVTVSYLINALLYGQGAGFSKTNARYLIRYYLTNHFVSITAKQRADALRLLGME